MSVLVVQQRYLNEERPVWAVSGLVIVPDYDGCAPPTESVTSARVYWFTTKSAAHAAWTVASDLIAMTGTHPVLMPLLDLATVDYYVRATTDEVWVDQVRRTA